LNEQNVHAAEEKTAKTFHARIPDTDRRLAIPALSSQFDPTEDGKIIVPSDRMSAGRAMRRRIRQALSQRQTIDEDIQETSNAGTKSEEPKR